MMLLENKKLKSRRGDCWVIKKLNKSLREKFKRKGNDASRKQKLKSRRRDCWVVNKWNKGLRGKLERKWNAPHK